MNYASDRLRFDTQRFDFVGLVLGALNERLRGEGIPELDRLEHVHTIPGIEARLEGYRQTLFSLFRTQAFQEVYRAFGADLIDRYFTPEAIVQKTPTVRIHLDGGRSVSFHSDAWYGHGEEVCSFWLPLTAVFGSNSLQVARSLEGSRAFLAGIEPAQLDLDEINTLAEELCEPVEAGFGDLVVFNGDLVHGTVDNDTGQSRVSFDFRIAQSVSGIGNKPANNYYTRSQLDEPFAEADTAHRSVATRKAYMYSGVCRGISAKSQLVFLNQYADSQKIDVVGSESEIVTFAYCPVLLKYAKNPPAGMDTLLLFSVDLLPSDAALRRQVYDGLAGSGVRMVFAAEDFEISGSEGIERAEQLIASNAPAHLAAA